MLHGNIAEPRQSIALEIYSESGEKDFFYLGPQAPNLSPNELELMHRLQLELNGIVNSRDLHNHEIVYFALQEVHRQLAQTDQQDMIQRLKAFLVDCDVRERH